MSSDSTGLLDWPLPVKLGASLVPLFAEWVLMQFDRVSPAAIAISFVLLLLAWVLPEHEEEGLALDPGPERLAFEAVETERTHAARLAYLQDRHALGEQEAERALAAVLARDSVIKRSTSSVAFLWYLGYTAVVVALWFPLGGVPWFALHLALSALLTVGYFLRWLRYLMAGRSPGAERPGDGGF